MTARALVSDGQVVRVGLPAAGWLSDGRSVSGYDRLPPETLSAEGWRELVDDGPPQHDPETHYARRTGHVYDQAADVVRVTWEVVERPPEPDLPPEPDGHHDPAIGAPDHA